MARKKTEPHIFRGAAMDSPTDAELAKLKAPHRQVLAEVAKPGMTYEKAAANLGWSLGTVRSRISRARDAIDKMRQPQP